MCILQCLGYCSKSYVRVLTQSNTLTIARGKAAKALKEEGETPEELLRSIKENEAAVAEAQRVVDAWKAIVGEESRREAAAKAEAERIATEKAEAERKAAEERERAEKEEKARIEAEKKEAERIAAEKAEEEARVEAERKAEEERKAKEEERKERDENGQPFVVSSDGTTTFGEITEDTGLTAAPIKLSEGVADEKGNGYGLRHIEARHGDQIRKAGFSSVEEFVKYVASNYDKHNIKIGKKRANGVETYLIQAEDEHSNMLYVELSKDGSYWNVNSGGIFRKGYAEKKKDVGQNTEHPTSATTLQDKSFVQTDKDNGSQSADTHSDKQHPSADKGTTLAADQQSSDKENTKKVADSEGENTLKAKIEAASADVNTEPTEAQKEAGNYKKGHVQVGTFDITIEQPEGSIRRGTDADGKKWESKMHNTYGYFRGTEGVDGDHIDVFLSNDIDGWNGRKVFVVDQYNPDGTFDEHKVMLGFNDMDEAKSDYLANYEKGWENGRRITVSTTNLEDFKKWIDSSHRKTKPFSEYSSVNKETVATDKGGEKAEKKQEKQSVFDKAKEIADKEEKKRKAEAEKKRPAPLSERIEDVGEKIGDARKDVWKEIIARIKNKKQGIEEALKKSSAGKLFSSLFDEKKLLESGVSNEVVTFISAVKGSLGTKPRSLSKLKMWINKVLHQYDMCEQALENWESVKKKIDEWKYYSQPFYMYRAAMAVGGYESGRDVGNAELWQIADGYSDGKSVAGQWCVRKAGAYDGIYKTYEEAAEALKKFAGENAAVDGKGKRKEVKLAIYKRRTDGTMFIAPEGKPDVIIQDGFKTLYEASAYKKEHYAEMQERYRTLMDGIKPKFNENRERKGRDWRGGKDVSAEDFREAFDFRGVEFGNWMQQKDRRQALNECYDSLMDLAMVCGVSPKALSLGGKLAMAFGARGVGKFNAHYEPDKVVINLTKTKGAGSLAHEWFHAIDNYFNMQGWDEFATESTRNVERKEMAEAWKDLVRAINGSDYFKRSDKYARLKGSRYWIEPTELGARAFAVWVENRLSKYGTINDYLANNPRLVDEKASDAEKKYAPYPFDKDADWMDEKFGRLFEVMQERVDEETGKHILYSRNKAAGHELTELTAEERELRDNLVERMRKGGLDVVTDSEEMQRVIDTENERTRMMGAGSVREHRVYHGSGADFDAFDHSHMGEGEGAQAYGWGTYVTEVEGIGRTYAEQNATTHNDALRALQHDVDAISDQLNRQRDDLKYDEEQLKRANEWRAEAELDYELFRDEAEKLKEKYGEASPKYRNHLFNDIYTDEMKRAQSSVKSTEESIQYRKEKIAELEKALKDKQAEIDELPKEFPRHLYTVEIPDDNGVNYLDWNGHPTESLLKDVGSFLESNGFERVQDNPARYEKGESTVVLNPNATGADLYAELREALGSDKKASQALSELGCIGIKYPADNMRGGRKDGAKNYVIFNENDAKITDHTRFLRTADGEVYGLVKDGRIYLDPKVATAETAVHEYTHLWGDMLRRKDSEQWSHTVKELKNSVLWEEVKELYPELKTDDEIADEVLSTFSGRRGAERLREEARRVAEGEGGVFTKAKAIETLERVKETIARFWEGVARMFGINRYRSAEELADMAMRDLINGVKPTSRTFTFDNFYKDTKAVFEGTERPKGKPDYTSYSGSEYWYGEDKGGKYVVRGSDHWSGEFKVKDGERTNVGRNHYSEITEDGMLPIGAQGSLKFGWEKGLSKPVGSGISAAIDRRGSGDSNNIASCYWYIDNAKEKDNKGFTYGKAYLSEFEDKERRRDIPGDDWRDIQGLEGGTRAMAERIAEQPVEEINNRFNEELEKYQNNELPKGHRFELGMPSAELQSAGFPTLPISMRSSLLAKKAGAERHPFAPTDLRDLVNAIQKPIAIFNYSKNNMRNLIVDVLRGGKHFLVGVTLNYKADNIEINSVSGLFPKENHEWIKWIQDGKVLRIDQKEKVQDLINSLRTNPAESERIGLNLDDVAKKVKDFENPKLFDGKISEVDKNGSDSIDRSVRENPKNEDKPRFSRKPGESIFDYASRVSEDVNRSVRERVSARDEYEKKVKSKGFQTKEALQNSMLGLQEFMSAIDHASGNKRYIEDIPDFENPILGENRLSSVNKEEMHQVAKTQFKPLMSAVAKLSGNGKESGELYDYMFAKHGLERDAVMRQREAQKEFDKYQKANPKGTKTIGDFVASLEGKDYAGLTALTAEDGRVKSIQSQIDAIDEQMKATDDQLLLRKLGGQKKRLKVDLLNAARDAADDIRKAFENNPSHDRSDINELWSRVNEVNGNTLRKLYESGMLTKEAYDDISSMYTNYIPMRGFDQTTSADAYAYLTHGDSAFNAPIKTAKGRSSKADNPIAYMQAMAESAIMQGNRNVLVKQKMLNFVRNHPSDLASVSDVWLQYDSVADEWKPFYAFGRESKG